MDHQIDREELVELRAAGRVTVVDALPASYFHDRHIPGAVNLVEADVATRADDLLPDQDAAIVTYCSDETCGNSAAVAAALRAKGYANVRTYDKGIKDWVGAGLETATGAPA